jgi:hypothetical protein
MHHEMWAFSLKSGSLLNNVTLSPNTQSVWTCTYPVFQVSNGSHVHSVKKKLFFPHRFCAMKQGLEKNATSFSGCRENSKGHISTTSNTPGFPRVLLHC